MRKIKRTPEQEREVKEYIQFKKRHCEINSNTGDWRDSRTAWADINRDKTEEEIFNKTLAERQFYDFMKSRGYDTEEEIEEALIKGEVPVDLIENGLVHDAFEKRDLPAIREGYWGSLSSIMAEFAEFLGSA